MHVPRTVPEKVSCFNALTWLGTKGADLRGITNANLPFLVNMSFLVQKQTYELAFRKLPKRQVEAIQICLPLLLYVPKSGLSQVNVFAVSKEQSAHEQDLLPCATGMSAYERDLVTMRKCFRSSVLQPNNLNSHGRECKGRKKTWNAGALTTRLSATQNFFLCQLELLRCGGAMEELVPIVLTSLVLGSAVAAITIKNRKKNHVFVRIDSINWVPVGTLSLQYIVFSLSNKVDEKQWL